MRATAAIAINVFRESVRDKVLYNLVLFAILLMARRTCRPADRRAGRQDHQGSRSGGDVAVRPVHRGLHRHRPGLEGGRAAQHLRLLAKPIIAIRWSLGKYCRPDADAGGQPRGDGGGALCRAGVHGLGRPAECTRRGTLPPLDPALLKALAMTFVELTLDHRDRAVLLDVLDADPVRGADVRLSSSSAISAPICAISSRSSTRRRRPAGARGSTGCCRTSRNSTSRNTSCTACRCRSATPQVRGPFLSVVAAWIDP